jgi:hypothetical protein
MRLSYGEIYNLYTALKSIDADAGVELDGPVRLAMAVNIAKLHPLAASFETTRNKIALSLHQGGQANGATSLVLAAEDSKLLGQIEEVGLKRIKVSDLKLDKSKRITPTMIAALVPILEDFDAD